MVDPSCQNCHLFVSWWHSAKFINKFSKRVKILFSKCYFEKWKKKAKHEKYQPSTCHNQTDVIKQLIFFWHPLTNLYTYSLSQNNKRMSYTTHYLKQKEAAGRSRTVDGEYLCLTIWVLSPGMSNTISILLTTRPHCITSINRWLIMLGLKPRIFDLKWVVRIFGADSAFLTGFSGGMRPSPRDSGELF